MKWAALFASLILASHPACAEENVSRSLTQWVTLGTGGGPLIRLKRSEPANALIVGDVIYLFDAGDGVLRQLVAAGLNPNAVRTVFISHHHFDHDIGLGPLIVHRALFVRGAPLNVVGPPGTTAMVAALSRAYVPIDLAPLTADQRAVSRNVQAMNLPASLDVPAIVYEDDLIRVLAVTNTHYVNFPQDSEEAKRSRSYSYRVESRGRSIVYTGDTGPSCHVVLLAKNADLLVSEVVSLPAMQAALGRLRLSPDAMEKMMLHMKNEHLTPAEVGELAKSAGVHEVVLTHLSPGGDQETSTAQYRDGVQAVFSGPVHVANDLDSF